MQLRLRPLQPLLTPIPTSQDRSAVLGRMWGSSAAHSDPRLWMKMGLPDSQLQHIWVTLSSWIPGHKLCTAPTRSYGCFSAFALCMFLPSFRFSSRISNVLSHTQSRRQFPKVPPFQGYQPLPFPMNQTTSQQEFLHTVAAYGRHTSGPTNNHTLS